MSLNVVVVVGVVVLLLLLSSSSSSSLSSSSSSSSLLLLLLTIITMMTTYMTPCCAYIICAVIKMLVKIRDVACTDGAMHILHNNIYRYLLLLMHHLASCCDMRAYSLVS